MLKSNLFNSLDQSAGAVEYTDSISAAGKCLPKECPGYNTKQYCLLLWGSSNGGALENAEYTFIAIVPWPTLTRIVSTW